jgi:hypothetical protein
MCSVSSLQCWIHMCRTLTSVTVRRVTQQHITLETKSTPCSLLPPYACLQTTVKLVMFSGNNLMLQNNSESFSTSTFFVYRCTELSVLQRLFLKPVASNVEGRAWFENKTQREANSSYLKIDWRNKEELSIMRLGFNPGSFRMQS